MATITIAYVLFRPLRAPSCHVCCIISYALVAIRTYMGTW